MPTSQSRKENDIYLVSQLERDISKALALEDTSRLEDLLVAVKKISMTSHILKATSIARLLGKVRKYHDANISASASSLVNEWKRIFREDMKADDGDPVTEYAKMPLQDFLGLDIQLSPLKDRQYSDRQTCYSTRVRIIQAAPPPDSPGRVVYWMSRDQRLCDNWALLKAQEVAFESSSPLAIVFALVANFPGANIRSYGFMLRNLKLLQMDAEHFNIPFFILTGTIPCVTHSLMSYPTLSHVVYASRPPRRSGRQLLPRQCRAHTRDGLLPPAHLPAVED